MPSNKKKSPHVRIPPDLLERIDAWVDRYCVDDLDKLPNVNWQKCKEYHTLPRSEVIRIAIDALEDLYGLP